MKCIECPCSQLGPKQDGDRAKAEIETEKQNKTEKVVTFAGDNRYGGLTINT